MVRNRENASDTSDAWYSCSVVSSRLLHKAYGHAMAELCDGARAISMISSGGGKLGQALVTVRDRSTKPRHRAP